MCKAYHHWEMKKGTDFCVQSLGGQFSLSEYVPVYVCRMPHVVHVCHQGLIDPKERGDVTAKAKAILQP